MRFKKKTLALMTAAALSVSFGNANASVIATAVVEFTDFRIYGATTDAEGNQTIKQLDASDFSLLKFTSTADADATLFGTAEAFTTGADSGSNGIDFPTKPGGATQVPNPNDLCVGDCVGTLIGATQNDNEFQHITLVDVTADGTSSYAWADQEEKGAPISGLVEKPVADPPVDVVSNADVSNSSYAYINDFDTGDGGSNSDNGLNSDFSFSVDNDQDFLEVVFTVDAFAYVEATALESDPFAAASTLFTLDIDGGTSWELIVEGMGTGFVVSGLSEALAVSTQTPGTAKTEATPGAPSTQHWRTTRSFLAADTDTLTARVETSVEVSRVPEPSTIALMGLAMLGFAGVRGRRKLNA